MTKTATKKLSKKALAEKSDRERRMAWWHEGRFGMFVHLGLYSLLGRHEWVQNNENIPQDEYDLLAERFNPAKGSMRQWAKLAKKAGMKYMVLTTKHHEGYCLWDSATTDFNAAKTGPKRDLIAEYVKACRAEGIKVGLYFSLMDWRHPDGLRCKDDEEARKRFVGYTHAQVRELMSNYGQVDLLWYDGDYPLEADGWEATKLNRMVRKLQPNIIINCRSRVPEDYRCPEEEIDESPEGRAWEACMTFNGSWGFSETHDDEWLSARQVIKLLRKCVYGGGNLLLNVGPKPDGSMPQQAIDRLTAVGKWLKTYGEECVYGSRPRGKGLLDVGNMLDWTRGKDEKIAYAWMRTWPVDGEVGIGWFRGKVKTITLLGPRSQTPVKFTQKGQRVVITGLPKTCPDKSVDMAVLKFECTSKPDRWMGVHVDLDDLNWTWFDE